MKVDVFARALLANGFGPFTGVPCSIIKDLITFIERSAEMEYYIATSEGEAMGIAGGFSLANRVPAVMMQNDGYGNAINPLSSLQLVYNLPTLLIITWRAQPGAREDAIQHRIMGKTLLALLETFDIPYSILDGSDDAKFLIEIKRAREYVEQTSRTYAMIIPRGYFEKYPFDKPPTAVDKPRRIDCIKALAKLIDARDAVLGTTGYTGRELYQEIRRPGIFYAAGSMGCITSIGLGIAMEKPDRRVYVLDGDGALLMKMGTLATIGYYRPGNFIHILFDNQAYESTGGQATVASVVDFPRSALGAGYVHAESVATVRDFERFIIKSRDMEGPIMCHVQVQAGTLPNLERPSEGPEKLRDQFRAFLADEVITGG